MNFAAQCGMCRHLYPGTRTCAAFAAGIPDSIWHEHADHRQPVDGDQGIRFERRDDVAAEVAEASHAFRAHMRQRLADLRRAADSSAPNAERPAR